MHRRLLEIISDKKKPFKWKRPCPTVPIVRRKSLTGLSPPPSLQRVIVRCQDWSRTVNNQCDFRRKLTKIEKLAHRGGEGEREGAEMSPLCARPGHEFFSFTLIMSNRFQQRSCGAVQIITGSYSLTAVLVAGAAKYTGISEQ